MASSSFSFSSFLCFFFISALLLFFTSSATELTDIDLDNPVSHLSPSPIVDHSTSATKDTLLCGRVRVAGLSRLKAWSYANSFRVTLTPSMEIPERLHGRIEVCFHQNASLELCHCGKDDWRPIQMGQWSTVMSPYQDSYVDVKFMNAGSGSFKVSLEEESHRWRLVCLAFGFVLLLLAPIFSNWVPFYYSSSMAIGILLVVMIILFQGMKLLPTGRKSAFYFTIYGSVVGAGSLLLRYFSMLVSSILMNFGLSEDMYNPVSVFVVIGIVIGGAGLGYWMVRKFIISEDGSIDVGIAQFVKWAMRIIGTTSILLSSMDFPLALVALASCWGTCLLLTSPGRIGLGLMRQSNPTNKNLWLRRAHHMPPNRNRAEFLSRSANTASRRSPWSSPKRSFAWSASPSKDLVLSSPNQSASPHQDYYSTFHKTPTRRRFSKKEWEDFTRESTRQALAEWASSPEFTDWVVENADRIRIDPEDEGMGSGSESTDETGVDNSNGLSFLKW